MHLFIQGSSHSLTQGMLGPSALKMHTEATLYKTNRIYAAIIAWPDDDGTSELTHCNRFFFSIFISAVVEIHRVIFFLSCCSFQCLFRSLSSWKRGFFFTPSGINGSRILCVWFWWEAKQAKIWACNWKHARQKCNQFPRNIIQHYKHITWLHA